MEKKINLNLDYAFDQKLIFQYQDRISAINEAMDQNKSQGFEFLGWKDLPLTYNKVEFEKIKAKAQFFINEGVEVLVVIGIGGSYLGAKSAIDFLQGLRPHLQSKAMEVIFIGTSISALSLYQTLRYVENKKFAINVISKSGTTLEPALAFRDFRKLLERKLGSHIAKRYIVATTDANRGLLFNLAKKLDYDRFVVPDNIGGRFSVLSAVGLFPIACAGINIERLMAGAKNAHLNYQSSDLNLNDAYKYAVARYLLHKKYAAEMLISYEPHHNFLLEWWKQLFAESEGKQNKGLLPTSAIFSRDLHSLGQFIQDGSKILFETIIWVQNPQSDLRIEADLDDYDELNYLADKSVHEINYAAFKGTLEAHTKVAQVPNIIINLKDDSPETLGALYLFFERAVAMSAYLLKVNPFDQPGVEIYKSNMFALLGKKN